MRYVALCVALVAVAASAAMGDTIPMVRGAELGWKEHFIRVGDGRGGWKYKTSLFQFLHITKGASVMPFGLAQMDNGEIIVLGSWREDKSEKPVAAFSKDRGDTWSDWTTIPGAEGRPMSLAYLGKGELTFVGNKRFFSHDYGRTWPDSMDNPPTKAGGAFSVEGNPLIDRDANGVAKAIAEIGWNYEPPATWPTGAADEYVRWSYDGGHTWVDEVKCGWRWTDVADGKTFTRGASEGSLVRARNGWIVAAIRSDMPARFLVQPNDDSLEGTAVSISKDNGKTWSPMKFIFPGGRHHMTLLKMPNGDLVMTLIVRDDVRGDDGLTSYARGCDALISKDNGVTWDPKRRYVLDEFEFFDGKTWYNGYTGHFYTALLDDGSILTAYGKYISNGVNLIRWRP